MHYLHKAFVTVCVLVIGNGVALVQPPPEDLVKTKLVADVTAGQPSHTFTLGVLFEMKPDWHIYWRNPGESGLATSIKFELPEGIEAGPLLWPAPERFIQPGDILGFGYTGSVVLASKVYVPTDVTETSIPIRAKIRWLACKDVCIPGSSELEMSLPISDSSSVAEEALFSEWESTLPVEPLMQGVEVGTAGELPSDGSPGEFTVSLAFKDAPSRVDWFPYAVRELRVTDAQITTEAAESRIDFEIALLKGHELSANELPTVITYEDESGQHKAFRVLVPLTGAR
jgi:thiol:disulfide interchange protein DsbD